MNDGDFIVYLCEQIWNMVSDGDEPDLKFIEQELLNRV